VKEVFWKIQLSFQIVVAVFIFILGVRIYFVTNPFGSGIIDLSMGVGVIFSVALVIFWILLLINAVNWLDGLDGLSGGVSLIACSTIFILSLSAEVYQPPIAIISAILAGTILGFLFFNFNPSKVLAGTSGSMSMGFLLAVLAIIAGTKIATALLVMAIPIIDLIWVIKERIRKGKSIFRPNKDHLHYKLMDLGWTQWEVAFFYWGVTIVISIFALNTRAVGKGITLLAAAIVMLVTYIVINKKASSKNKA
jgi:UDP-GlcNAc:undecaprenyl-phosphate GlcNAc-1-phosphate transferase